MRGRSERYSLLEGRYLQEFRDVIKSAQTMDEYERKLSRFLETVGMNLDSFIDKARQEPSWAQNVITDLIRKWKQRIQAKEIEASSLRNFLKPVRLACDVYELGVNWKKLAKMLPEGRRYALDRAPTMEELRTLTNSKDIRFRAILLMMCSGGFRVGAWDYLRVKDIEPVEREGQIVAARVRIYAGEAEEYFTFVTPEAYKAFQSYLELRKDRVTPESPALDPVSGERMGSVGVKRVFDRTLWKLGMRREKKKRHEFSIHSVRKFFKTRCEQVMKPINVETLMGHSTGISDSYYRPTEKDLLDDYLKAVPLLTVSEVEEVRRESQLSREEMETRVKQLEDIVSRLTTSIGQQALNANRIDTGLQGNRAQKKVVGTQEIDRFINEGWEPVMTLPDGRIVMKYG